MNALPPNLPVWAAALALAPAVVAATAAIATRFAPVARGWRMARAATTTTAAIAVAVLVARAAIGPRANGMVRIDNVTVAMLGLIALVGWVVVRYSTAYLAGDPHERRYVQRILATLAAVGVVVVANHLGVLLAAWAAASIALHGLLTFFGDRPVAVAVAHKKFLLARVADACMIGAAIAFGTTFHTLRIDAIGAHALAHDGLPTAARVGVLLVAMAAILKCAQLPFHGWLIQVMEAPTPVSALLHAGLVNLGGFVLLRFAPVVDRAIETRVVLVAVGVFTAVVASLVMTTRVSVKVALAWSTCAQMGFMLVQCGLGLWEMAMLHLVAHSLYKAHAFLGAGGTVRQTQRRQLAGPRQAPTPRTFIVAVVAAVVATTAVGMAWMELPFAQGIPARVWVMLGIVALAVVPLATRTRHSEPVALVIRSLSVPVAYLALHEVAGRVVPLGAAAPRALLVLVALGFVALFTIQSVSALAPDHRAVRRIRPWIYAGLFLDEAFTRLAFAISPPKAPAVRAAPLPQPTSVAAVRTATRVATAG